MSHEDVGHRDRKPRAKAGAGVGGTADNAEFRGYINLSLSDEEKSAWEAWSVTPDVWACLDAQVEQGVNIAVKRERATNGYVASATQRDPSSPNAGLCVTARGRGAGVALTRVLWCLAVLGRSDRWEDTQPLANPDRW
jgi:hypothetical protein